MEAQTQKHSEGIKVKIPDIEKAVESVQFLQDTYSQQKSQEKLENINIDFMVAHNLWAKAEVPVQDKVCLWLGADVLCEYTHEEALVLLNKNLLNARTTLKTNEETIDFLRDQITVCEVNISRAYNEYLESTKKAEKK
jgi:prefoldin subunit 5